jgi:hypothetical protein
MVDMNSQEFRKILETAKTELIAKGNFTEIEVLELALEKAQIKCVNEIDYKFKQQKNNLFQEIDDTFFNLKRVIESEINNRNDNNSKIQS